MQRYLSSCVPPRNHLGICWLIAACHKNTDVFGHLTNEWQTRVDIVRFNVLKKEPIHINQWVVAEAVCRLDVFAYFSEI